ncbi:hypothetical protein BOTNAR_0010g00380 [Botryotinia narcissicola]|uniref:Uncharacterized protein n=1 Tax=Botryotinia narcissicola TaxID=278944 RepID=A0A4Z1J784_9HELO|nr:hypothetical protein BOTNAR_0010g00380 [Botryotinia narcissicola]
MSSSSNQEQSASATPHIKVMNDLEFIEKEYECLYNQNTELHQEIGEYEAIISKQNDEIIELKRALEESRTLVGERKFDILEGNVDILVVRANKKNKADAEPVRVEEATARLVWWRRVWKKLNAAFWRDLWGIILGIVGFVLMQFYEHTIPKAICKKWEGEKGEKQ